MSRALGDVIGNHEAGLIETPDYRMANLKQGRAECVAIVTCSDGVWEVIIFEFTVHF